METTKIKALMAALDSGSLMKAADTLGYTSSGLTHMMNSLEQELHVTLLVRSPSGVEPTEECRQLMPAFEKIVQDEERLASELELLSQQKKRLIRLGIFSSTSRNMVPQIIKEYTALHPDTAFQLQVGGKEDTRATARVAPTFIAVSAAVVCGASRTPPPTSLPPLLRGGGPPAGGGGIHSRFTRGESSSQP
jgi:DNA-binding transcriptional LysR family regulator